MKKFFLLFLFCVSASSLSAGLPSAEIYNPPLSYIQNGPDWGFDYLVSATEPLGKPSLAYRGSTNTLYAAIPDTNIAANKCIVLLKSTNNGANWTIHGSITPAAVVPKVKLVATADSMYCFFLYNSTVYAWNVLTNRLVDFTAYTNIRDFDVTISSTSSLYLIIDLIGNNQVRLFGSNDGGTTWAYSNFLSSTAAHPRISMSATGDTAIINYYGVTIAPDTISSAIRSVRYRESAPGSMLIVGAFSTPVAAGVPKDQFMSVMTLGKVWLFYTSGSTGSIDLKCMVSLDNGTTFGSAVSVSSNPNRDEYWFDASNYDLGVDIIFYSDSLQAGPPTPASDMLMHTFASQSQPETFPLANRISQRSPGWSERGYLPSLVEYRDGGDDIGALWVGQDGANRKVYFDRYLSTTRINNNNSFVSDNYSLSQNYPNPFNPVTKIDFSISKSEFVSIKVYDVTGKEITTLVNLTLPKGSYTVDFNASNLSTGVYFYKLQSGTYSEVKKMMLLK